MQVGQKIGPFDVEKKIGAGAMGAVYLARYRKTGQRVAIKMMLMGLADNDVSLARFEREAEVLKQLNHQNIVRFYVANQYEGTPYYAMEYVEGEPLDQALLRKGRLTWEEVVELGAQVCAALQHAHDQGIVHRDLKPSNLMITPDGTLKLTDFGIAKDLDVTQLTSANCTVGTAAYMSPEQCRGERNLTHKSDLYSLGVVLYELLTGRKPFEAETTMDMFLQHVQGSFERPSRNVLDIPIWLDTLVCQLLEKEPAKRPYDARTVSDALGQVTEKVLAQRSAGVDAAQARIVDRSTMRGASLDETDKQAARTILTSMRKGKRKRRGKPLHEQKWLQAIGLMLALGGVAAMIYQAFRPPTAQQLYARAETLMNSPKDAGDADTARKEPIAKYLRYYGYLDDEPTRTVWQWARKYDLAQKERQLERLRLKGYDPDSAAGRHARRAADKEDAADLATARLEWEQVVTGSPANKERLQEALQGAEERWQQALRKEDDPGDALWVMLAGKRLEILDAAAQAEERLRKGAEEISAGKPFDVKSAGEGRALDAFRFQAFGDPGRARQVWQNIRQQAGDSVAERSWHVLAGKNIADLNKALTQSGKKPDEDDGFRPERLRLLSDKVNNAEKIIAKKQGQDVNKAVLELRELVYLYQNDEDQEIREIAKRAAALVQNFSPAEEKQPADSGTRQGPP